MNSEAGWSNSSDAPSLWQEGTGRRKVNVYGVLKPAMLCTRTVKTGALKKTNAARMEVAELGILREMYGVTQGTISGTNT